jgi:hypothetical protein
VSRTIPRSSPGNDFATLASKILEHRNIFIIYRRDFCDTQTATFASSHNQIPYIYVEKAGAILPAFKLIDLL